MLTAFPTLLVSRRPRQIGSGWSVATSWFGGAPRIGAIPWPRKKGTPLHFLAQIDFAEVAAAACNTTLPTAGSLAFFVGEGGTVVFVPDGVTAPVSPPADTPDMSACGGSQDWLTDLADRPLFPYWPIAFTRLDVAPPATDDDDAHDEFVRAQAAAVETHLGSRAYNLSPEQAFAGPPIPDWWQTALYYATYIDKAVSGGPDVLKREQSMLDYAQRKLEEARSQGGPEVGKAEASVKLYEGKIARVLQLEPTLRAFAGEVTAFSQGRDPWELMNPDELKGLAALWARNPEFDMFHHNSGRFPIDYLKNQMFKALPAVGTHAFTVLPSRVRDLISEKRAPRPQWWFMAVHYAKRLRKAVQAGIPDASKFRQNNLAAYRKRLDLLQPPRDMRAVFGRKRGPKSKDEIALEADIARTEAELADLRRLEPAFVNFVEETSSWVQGRDPWALMDAADLDQLKARIKRVKDEFWAFAGHRTPGRLQDLEALTFRVMATAEDRGYAALPEPVRALINRECLRPPGRWHQMFGRGVEIQGNSSAMREEGNIMLLQLVADDLMQWSFGDNGVYQFWISPSDLAAQNWAGVQMTFECH